MSTTTEVRYLFPRLVKDRGAEWTACSPLIFIISVETSPRSHEEAMELLEHYKYEFRERCARAGTYIDEPPRTKGYWIPPEQAANPSIIVEGKVLPGHPRIINQNIRGP